MKRWLANLVIASYLGVMSFGIFSHTMQFMHGSHPVMYFVVWDMFCGWSAYSNRIHIVGEGESGTYYDLSRGPWGEFKPYSEVGRRNYDYNTVNLKNISKNVLRQTAHEPMVRTYIFEENWAKKYNMPDYVWNRLYQEPKEFKSYYSIRHILNGQSEITQTNNCWVSQCVQQSFRQNPRLQREAQASNPYLQFTANSRWKPEKGEAGNRSGKENHFFDNQNEPAGSLVPAGN